jgi:hypothetical protein
VYPKPLLDRIEPSVDALVAHIEEQTDYEQPAVADEGFSIVEDELPEPVHAGGGEAGHDSEEGDG